MNNDRRKRIAKVRALIEQMSSLYEEAKSEVESVKEDEEDARSNLPESLENSDRAQTMDNALEKLDEVVNAFETFDIEQILNDLDEAAA